MADKKTRSKLVESNSVEKIFQIDEHIGCATSGLVADARTLEDYARIIAQINKVTYEEKISTEMLVKRICDYKQNYTQYGGVRPFGTALLVGGVDSQGIHLFETDPSGALSSYKAGCIGSGRAQVIELFENKFKDGMSMDDAIVLGLEGLKLSGDEVPTETTVEIGIIKKGEKFVRLEPDQLSKYASKL